MSTTTTPNMGLIVPTVGSESGPLYATDINGTLSIVDGHSHTTGSGVPIVPSAININSALTFNNQLAINLAGTNYLAQSSPPTAGTAYISGVDLYFVDGNSNNVRLTQSGSIVGTAGSITGLPSGTASATYVSASSTFVWQSATGIAANLDAGALKLRNLSPNSTFAITLQAPASLGSNYSLTLPPLPASTKFMALDSSGNITAPYSVDGTTIVLASNVLTVGGGGIGPSQLADGSVTNAKLATNAVTGGSGGKIAAGTIQFTEIATNTIISTNMANGSIGTSQLAASGVTTAKIAANAVTPAKLSALNVAASLSSGAFSQGASATNVVTNLSVTLTASGSRAMMIMIQPDATTSSASMTGSNAQVAIRRDGVQLWTMNITSSSQCGLTVFDNPSAGSHTYDVVAITGGGGNCSVGHVLLVAYEF